MNKSAKYLFRFDDICPTMNWQVWDEIEIILLKYDIKPIVAVVPDNRDPNLMVSEVRSDFWQRVLQWQKWGWIIALHGYQHLYVNNNPGLLGITPASEFAGLNRTLQKAKLTAGLDIFQSHGITTETWVAPSHSFDVVTLDVLKNLGIRFISDGFFSRHFIDQNGLIWLPCQQWDRIHQKQTGIYTVCIHHNHWTKDSVDSFRADIQAHHAQIVSLPKLLATTTPSVLRLHEHLQSCVRLFFVFRLRRMLKLLLNVFWN